MQEHLWGNTTKIEERIFSFCQVKAILPQNVDDRTVGVGLGIANIRMIVKSYKYGRFKPPLRFIPVKHRGITGGPNHVQNSPQKNILIVFMFMVFKINQRHEMSMSNHFLIFVFLGIIHRIT